MKKSLFTLTVTFTILLTLLLANTGCGKKVKPEPPKTEPAASSSGATASGVVTVPETPKIPQPKVTLSVTPSAIEKGQSATLSWQSENTDKVTIDNGIGTVDAYGKRTIVPNESTTYMAKAVNAAGSAVAEARITVMAPQQATPPPESMTANDATFFETKIKDVFFDLDEYSIRDDAKQILMENARALAERPGIRVTIEGYCDERGSEKYNLVLGDKRANAVKEFLISLGVSGSRIDTISYGEEKNFCEDHTEDCWQLNRRGHFVSR